MKGFVTAGDPLDHRQPQIAIFNDVGGTTNLPAGRYRVQVERRWNDYEIGGRMAGVLLDEHDIETAREVGTTGWTPDHFEREYGGDTARRVRAAAAKFDPTKVYFAADSFEQSREYDPAEFDDDDRESFAAMGYTFRCDNQVFLDDGTEACDVLHVLPDGQVSHVQHFAHADALEDASSYMAAAIETATYSIEERLGPYGLEWEREQRERQGLA